MLWLLDELLWWHSVKSMSLSEVYWYTWWCGPGADKLAQISTKSAQSCPFEVPRQWAITLYRGITLHRKQQKKWLHIRKKWALTLSRVKFLYLGCKTSLSFGLQWDNKKKSSIFVSRSLSFLTSSCVGCGYAARSCDHERKECIKKPLPF